MTGRSEARQSTRRLTRWECPTHGPGNTFTTDSPTAKEFCSRCYPKYVPMVRVEYVPKEGS